MDIRQDIQPQVVARLVGISMLATIVIGILSAIFVVGGIDVNMTADIRGTTENMLEASTALQAKAYISTLIILLELFVLAGLFLLLKRYGALTAWVSLLIGLCGVVISFLGVVSTLNVAVLVSHVAGMDSIDADAVFNTARLEVINDYASFHLGLVVASLAKAGFFSLFLRSGSIPKLISGWGVLASLFVASMIVMRSFIPALGAGTITMVFILSNLIAIVVTGVYLSIWGVRYSVPSKNEVSAKPDLS